MPNTTTMLPLLLLQLLMLPFTEAANGYLNLDIKIVNGLPLTNLQLGSNKDTVSLVVDTGSAELWAVTSDNSHCAPSSFNTSTDLSYQYDHLGRYQNSYYFNCSMFGTYNTKSSTTSNPLNRPFSILYSSFQYANGEYITDQISYDSIPLGTFQFASVNSSSEAVGVLGLGVPELQYSARTCNKSYATVPKQLTLNGVIDTPTIAVYLNETHGNLLFGGIDHSKYTGDLHKFPMIPASEFDGVHYSAITLTSFSITENDHTITALNRTAPVTIDSGSSISQLPSNLYNFMTTELNLTLEPKYNIFYTNCSAIDDKTIDYNFNGVSYTQPLKSLFQQDNNTCVFMASKSIDDKIILGVDFLQHNYAIFDWQNYNMLLAKINHDESSNIVPFSPSVDAIKPPHSVVYSTTNTTTPASTITSSTHSSSAMSISPSWFLIIFSVILF